MFIVSVLSANDIYKETLLWAIRNNDNNNELRNFKVDLIWQFEFLNPSLSWQFKKKLPVVQVVIIDNVADCVSENVLILVCPIMAPEMCSYLSYHKNHDQIKMPS